MQCHHRQLSAVRFESLRQESCPSTVTFPRSPSVIAMTNWIERI
jgi:hypothetical protein